MILNIADWCFDVDTAATTDHTVKNSKDHCCCSYCKNFYEAMGGTYPELPEFLRKFGVDFNGPSEVMPFEPTLVLACYPVHGKILQWGSAPIIVEGVPVTVETAENDTFLLWVGEMALPWLQEEDMDEVVSPANLPEFLARMEEVWLLRHGENLFFS